MVVRTLARYVATAMHGPGVKPSKGLFSDTNNNSGSSRFVSAIGRRISPISRALGYPCEDVFAISQSVCVYITPILCIWLCMMLPWSSNYVALDNGMGSYHHMLEKHGLLRAGELTDGAVSISESIDPSTYYRVREIECVKGAKQVRVDPSSVSLYRMEMGSWLKDQHLASPCRPVSVMELREGIFILDADREHGDYPPQKDNGTNTTSSALPTHHYISLEDMITLNELLLDQNPRTDFVSPKHYRVSAGGTNFGENDVSLNGDTMGGNANYWKPSHGFNPCIVTLRIEVREERHPGSAEYPPAASTDESDAVGEDADPHFTEAIDDEYREPGLEDEQEELDHDSIQEVTSFDMYLTLINPVIVTDVLKQPASGSLHYNSKTHVPKIRVEFSEGDIYYPRSFVLPAPGDHVELAAASVLRPGATEKHVITGEYAQVLLRTAVAALKGFTFTS